MSSMQRQSRAPVRGLAVVAAAALLALGASILLASCFTASGLPWRALAALRARVAPRPALGLHRAADAARL